MCYSVRYNFFYHYFTDLNTVINQIKSTPLVHSAGALGVSETVGGEEKWSEQCSCRIFKKKKKNGGPFVRLHALPPTGGRVGERPVIP